MIPRTKIFWCSDSPNLPTGFTNQSNYIVSTLANIHEMYWYAHQWVGNEEMRNNYAVLPGGHSRYGENEISYFVNKYKPELMCWLCDAFMIPWVVNKKKEWLEKIVPGLKTLFYYPLDSEDVYSGMKETLESFDYRIAMSKFARDFVYKMTGIESYYIPHCTNINDFYPISQEEKEKIKEQNGFKDKFVVGMVGRNQSRKNPARLIPILKEFFSNKDDAMALFHCDPFDPQGHNLVELAKTEGILDKIKFTGVTWYNGFNIPTLNNVYNTLDTMALTTTGEGFGITAIEALACKVPCVISDYTSTKEILVEDGRCGIPVSCPDYIHGGMNTKRVIPDFDEFVKALDKLYYKPKVRNHMGEIGRSKVMKYYSLQNVMPQWIQFINEIVEEDFNIEYLPKIEMKI